MESEDDEDYSVFCGSGDPYLYNIDFSVKESEECVTKAAIADMFRESIERLNQVSFELSSPKAKRKLSGEDKIRLSNEVSQVTRKIQIIMCKLHINDRVNVVNHSNNVSKSNDSTICVPTYRQSQFSILDGLGCSVSDQSQIINLNAESLDSCLDGLDCITSVMQSQTINPILDRLDCTTSVVQSQTINSILDGLDCTTSVVQSQTINPILDGLDCITSVMQSQTINPILDRLDCTTSVVQSQTINSILDGLDCTTSVVQSQTINPILDGLDCTTSVVQSQTINPNLFNNLEDLEFSNKILDETVCLNRSSTVRRSEIINPNTFSSHFGNDHTYDDRNFKRLKLDHDNTHNTPVLLDISASMEVVRPVNNSNTENLDNNTMCATSLFTDHGQMNNPSFNQNSNNENPSKSKNKRNKRRRRYGDLQRKELENAFNKINKLRRSIRVYSSKQEDLTVIKKHITQCDKYKEGIIDTDDIICNHKGRITVICHSEDMVDLVQTELRIIGFNSIKPKINNILICSHGVPVKMNDDEIMNEIFRDKKYNKENIKIIDKFKYSDAAHTVVFSISPDLIESIFNKPNFHIKGKKYNIFYFVKLIQCFNCADFGHFGVDCSANPKCLNCGGNHDKTKCSDHNFVPKCANCTKQNLPNTNHSSWDVGCTYRKRFIQLNRIRFNYG